MLFWHHLTRCLLVQPCFLFVGEPFERDERFKLVKSLLVDTFRGQEITEMNLMSVSHVIVCMAAGDAEIKLRHYAVLLKKSGTRVRTLC
jgi:ribosome production factor 2